LASLGLALCLYVIGLYRISRNARIHLFGTARCLSFTAGIAILFAALISPLDALDDQLFSAHMAQHLVLIMVAPPLLVAGRPAMAWLWAFPLPARRAMGRFWAATGLRGAVHALMSPVIVWILCSAALWFWHLPGPYGWALANEFVHAVEHLCFFVTSLMFWSLVLEPVGRSRRLGYAGALLFVATFGIQNGLLGALLTFSGRSLYAAYLPTTAAWGLTPLEDQQIGGLGMWIPASLIHLTTLGVLLVAWLRSTENHASVVARPDRAGLNLFRQRADGR
jgi:cytochrome c oxidase assembly factor CtaG